MSVTSEMSSDGKTKTIKINGRFDFSVQSEFRDSYHDLSGDDKVNVIVDMNGANYMDSSALGMLLMMREHLGGDSASIVISNCSSEIKNILNVANFQSLFQIQ